MADVARGVISKIIQAGDVVTAASSGITQYWFDEHQHRRAYKWLTEYFERYGESPTKEALLNEFPTYRLLDTPEPYEYYIDRLKRSRRRGILVDGIIEANAALDEDDTITAETRMRDAAERASLFRTGAVVNSVRASEVKPRRVKWIWWGRIPRGKLTLVTGEGGVGKTTMVVDVIARLSSGRRLPGHRVEKPPMTCLIMTAEDDLEDTLVPRLIAARANRDNITFIKGRPTADGEALLSLPDNVDLLRSEILRTGAAVLFIDPFNAFLSGGIDSYKDADIRRVLAPLARLADETGVALLLIFHLGKSAGRNALQRIVGSVGIGNAARSVLIVAPNPENTDQRVLAVTKASNSVKPSSLLFEIVGTQPFNAAKAKWLARSDLTADELAAPHRPAGASALGIAVDFLSGLFPEPGYEMPFLEVQAKADAAGISEATLRRAQHVLGIRSRKAVAKVGNPWVWYRPAS